MPGPGRLGWGEDWVEIGPPIGVFITIDRKIRVGRGGEGGNKADSCLVGEELGKENSRSLIPRTARWICL